MKKRSRKGTSAKVEVPFALELQELLNAVGLGREQTPTPALKGRMVVRVGGKMLVLRRFYPGLFRPHAREGKCFCEPILNNTRQRVVEF